MMEKEPTGRGTAALTELAKDCRDIENPVFAGLEKEVSGMKTLIFNGSPRKNGETASMVRMLRELLPGEIVEIRSYDAGIASCVDCRYCFTHAGCCVKDGMQEVYQMIEEADNIVIASPIYFSELTGSLLGLLSRLQTYFCAQYIRHEALAFPEKRGGVINAYGGGEQDWSKPYDTAKIILHAVNVKEIYPVVYAYRTDERRALDDPRVREGIQGLAEFLTVGTRSHGE